MEIPATVSSKGQVTIPAEVRKALGLRAGDHVVFRVMGGRAILRGDDAASADAPNAELEKIPDFFDLAGSVPTPADVDPANWTDQQERAWSDTARSRL